MNRFGLSREIPDKVKREVRQRDGFGCVICGKAVYDYEHFDPEYADAKVHDPNGIVLLCIEHHGLKTRRLLSKQSIRDFLLKPKCKQLGFSYGPFDIGTIHPEVVLGQLRCTDVRCLISLEGDEVLSVSPPIKLGLPFRLNADFRGADGSVVLRIINNEWRSETSSWDVDTVGPVITIRNAPRKISLVIRSEPPERIVIERLEMFHKGHKIFCREGSDLVIETANGSRFSAYAVSVRGFDTAVEIKDNSIGIAVNRPRYPLNLGFIGMDISSKSRRNLRCKCGSGRRYKHCHGR